MYPILIRPADRGWLKTPWETEGSPGRPPRHLYRVTKAGLGLGSELRNAAGERPAQAKRAQPLGPRTCGDRMSPLPCELEGAAERLLATALRWMPKERREWGSAMAAELAHLAHLEDPWLRWRFSLGCLRVALFPPRTETLLQTVTNQEMKHASTTGPTTNDATLAAIRGGLLLMPFVITNAIVANRIEPLFSIIRPGVHTSPQEYMLPCARCARDPGRCIPGGGADVAEGR